MIIKYDLEFIVCLKIMIYYYFRIKHLSHLQYLRTFLMIVRFVLIFTIKFIYKYTSIQKNIPLEFSFRNVILYTFYVQVIV